MAMPTERDDLLVVAGRWSSVGPGGGAGAAEKPDRHRKWSLANTRPEVGIRTNEHPAGRTDRQDGGEHTHLLLKTCLVLEHFHRLLSNFPIFNMI